MSFIKENKIAILGALSVLTISLALLSLISVVRYRPPHIALHRMDYGAKEPKTYYNTKPKKFTKPNEEIVSTQIQSEQQTAQQDIITTSITTEEYREKVELYNVTEPNLKLYQIADQYFQVYYQNRRISPIYPLALANVETPGRANHEITWSALFPTKVVPMSLIDTFNVTNVAQDPVTYNDLMHESSTRDRGALQMSPTYGTKDSYFNSLMSGTETAKLANIQINPNAINWAAGASSQPGDRFDIHDVCLRLASAGTNACQQLELKGIQVHSDAELIVMLAMYHHRSGVWQVSGAGGWKSTDSCLAYVQHICSQSTIDVLRSYYKLNPEVYTLPKDIALNVVGDYTNYTTSSLEASYPIKVLYSYIVLMNKYGQKI